MANVKANANELVYYVRSKRVLPIVEEKVEIVEKKTAGGKVKRIKRNWIRLGRGPVIGVIVSSGYNSVGWSLCARGDAFDKETAFALARKKEQENQNQDIPVPFSIRNRVAAMMDRSRRYFKQKK